jgi:glycosyltransferase involved in cell wall biosynthesis
VSRATAIRSDLVSVVIPVHDGRFLDEALESVLAQDHRPLEVVVVDSSASGLGDLVARHGPLVRYEWQEPVGIGSARNRGVELATGELLTFLDSDDLFEPGRLRLQVAALERDPSLEAVFGHVTEFVQPGLPATVRRSLRAPRDSFPSHLVWTMLIRRAAFDRIGAFVTDFVVGETIEWYARAQSAGLRSVMLDQVVARRRLHGANTGMTRWDARQDFVRVAREALERRRAGGR